MTQKLINVSSQTPKHGDTVKCDYKGTPPFADAAWKDDPTMCQWCAGTGHPHGDERYGMCKCPALQQEQRKTGKTAFYFSPTIGSRVSVDTDKGTEEGVVTRHDWKEGKPIFYYDQVTFFEGAVVEKDKWAWLEQLESMSF